MMTKFEILGENIRYQTKELILNYMKQDENSQENGEGIKLAELFRACGLDWGEQPNATSSNQQYWLVALMRDLENEGKVERDLRSKKWRLK